jgi:hypothetical protein
VGIEQYLLKHALTGPTSDLEDKIQLHSCAKAECGIFLASDIKTTENEVFW